MSADAFRFRACCWFKRAAASAGVVAALAIVSRFVYTASQVETGWLLIADRWLGGTIGQFYSYEPVPNREPPEQAAYWLPETERIVAGSPPSARLAMGAAWVLDSPAPGFRGKHVEPPPVPMLPPTLAKTEQAERAFEERCAAKCLDFARQATDAEPANLAWRRMRALLLMSCRFTAGAGAHAPRTADWEEILDEAARHDPDNALYDYLAALNHWNASGDYDWNVAYVITVKDDARFASGVARFEQGQKKKFLAFGEAGLPAIVEFLERSGLTLHEQAGVLRGTLCVMRPLRLIIDLTRWQMARADDRAAAGEPSKALELLDQRSRVLDQAAAAREWTADDLNVRSRRQQGPLRAVELAQANAELATREELDRYVRDCRAAILQNKVWQEAARRAAKPAPPPSSSADLLQSSLLVSAPESVAVLLLVGLLGWLLARWAGEGAEPDKLIAAWQHGLTWLAAFSASFVVLGMAPAEQIRRETQRKAAAAIVVGAVLFIGWLLWRTRFRFSLRAAFVAVFVCAVMCLPLAGLHRQGVFNDLESLAVPPKGGANLDAATLQAVVKIPPQSWNSAAWQWLLHSGALFAALVCPLLAAAWSALRRIGRKPSEERRSSRAWWSALFRDAGRSALALAALLLLVDFALLPKSLLRTQREYDEIAQFFRDPRGSYDDFRKALGAVENDKNAMDGFQETVDREMAELLKPSR